MRSPHRETLAHWLAQSSRLHFHKLASGLHAEKLLQRKKQKKAAAFDNFVQRIYTKEHTREQLNCGLWGHSFLLVNKIQTAVLIGRRSLKVSIMGVPIA